MISLNKLFKRNKTLSRHRYSRLINLSNSFFYVFNLASLNTSFKVAIDKTNYENDGLCKLKVVSLSGMGISIAYDKLTDPEIHKIVKKLNMKQVLYKGE